MRKILFNMFNGFKRQFKTSNATPQKPKALDVEYIAEAKKKLRKLAKSEYETAIVDVLEYVEDLEVDQAPPCYINILYEV